MASQRIRSTRGRVLILGVLTALLVAALLGSQISASSAKSAKKTSVTTITMKTQGHRLFFDAPKTVQAGSVLRIQTLTTNVGPHTFSLVDPSAYPKTKPARQKCFTPGHICLAIAKWQGFKPPGTITINPAKAGAAGWDTEGSLAKKGDSWFAGSKKGNSFQQIVSAEAGTTLHFMCAVHPFMQGSIKVVAGS